MGWDEYWKKAHLLGLSEQLTAGSLIISGLSKKSRQSLEPARLSSDFLVRVKNPFDFVSGKTTPATIQTRAQEWQRLANPLQSILSRCRFAVGCQNWDHLDDISRMFRELQAGPIAWSVVLPGIEQPVELLWPLRVGVIAGPQFPIVRSDLQDLRDLYDWLRPILTVSTVPAGEAGSLDIAVFPEGRSAVSDLSRGRLPVHTEVLLLVGESRDDIRAISEQIPELLSLTHAQAVIAGDVELLRSGWLASLVMEVSHNNPWDVAIRSSAEKAGLTSGQLVLFATPEFLSKGRLSTIESPIRRRLNVPPLDAGIGGGGEDLDEEGVVPPTSFGGPPEDSPALLRFEESLRVKAYEHETGTSTVIAETIKGLIPLTPVAEDRFVQARMTSSDTSSDTPATSVEAGKPYQLQVRVAPREKNWVVSREIFPEPPLKPQETSLLLTVLFHERHSCPDGVLQTIELPRMGASSVARFPITVSGESSVFDSRITIYHNNRPLIESAFRAAVLGAKSSEGPAPVHAELVTLMRTRAFDANLSARSAAAGSLRVEGERVFVVRGTQKAAIAIGGYKEAVKTMETEINKVDLEKIEPAQLVKDKDAATLLATLAQQGRQLHDQLTQSEAMKLVYEDGGLMTVLAADGETRVPFELCYSFEEPAQDSPICPSALEAVGRGHCVQDCAGGKDPGHYVCPMGFWGLQRSIEWRSTKADEYQPGEPPVVPAPDREQLAPLRQVLFAKSARVLKLGALDKVLTQLAAPVKVASSWMEWTRYVNEASPSLLVLMPHVDKTVKPPAMEIGGITKDPPGVKLTDVTVDPSKPPVVLVLGCGAAVSTIDYQSLPNQFRRWKAAVVIAPIAEILARDAPELTAALITEFASGENRPLADAVLASKRALVAGGYLSGLLLLCFGDADWKV
jgi:hypothetical protein